MFRDDKISIGVILVMVAILAIIIKYYLVPAWPEIESQILWLMHHIR